MPIISLIGRRSAGVRFLMTSIYVLLILGAATMVYPLLLMLAGSVRSEADAWSIRPYPEFWFDRVALFQKYCESKYNGATLTAQKAWCRPVPSWRTVTPPDPVDPALIDAFRGWRETLPAGQRTVGHVAASGMLPKNQRAYRRRMETLFDGDVTRYNAAANQSAATWPAVSYPVEMIGRYVNRRIPDAFWPQLTAWKATVPAADSVVHGLQGEYAWGYLYRIHGSRIELYNEAHGTHYAGYHEIPCPVRAPAAPGRERDDWSRFVRLELPLRRLCLDPSQEPAFRQFLRDRHATIAAFNKERRTALPGFDSIPFPAHIDVAPYLRLDFEAFISSPQHCPIEALSIRSMEEAFAAHVVGQLGRLPPDYPGFGAVVAATDWADCQAQRPALTWELTMRNYWQVIDFMAMHGRGFLNTVYYCLLAVLTALVVNPIAAYALSRFKLPSTYSILLFFMATMAFPAEIQMIPSFVLLKRFPLWPILAGLAVTMTSFLLLERLARAWREGHRALLSLAAGLLTGGIAVPALGPQATTTSLLNSFAALVLPGMASGYSIFLLKGFFDSLPKELYEAAELDGAGEWTKFWMLTMNLSKPILAVIALGAFTGAYSAFMMALIVIPDPSMWTLMVWIFQLQSQAHQSVVYASLVIAAIPTLTIFVLCQNVILRGIVVPTEK